MKKIAHIEAVTVCVGYDDFLSETAKYNIPLFEKWVIVTEPQDERTREVCRKNNLQCILSDEGGSGFSKGRLIERGLQHLSADGWRLHIDSDIALPHRFRHLLECADLQTDTIYGIDRMMVRGYRQWLELQKSFYLHGGQYDYMCRVNLPKDTTLGGRWAHPEMGYVPIGFFQLWHSSQDEWRGVRVRPYPMNHGNACRTDVQHALQWDRKKRALIPEIIGVHLESEIAPKGVNWQGRKTKRFGPEHKCILGNPY